MGRLNLAKAWLSPGFDTTSIDTAEIESPLVKLDLYTKILATGALPPDTTDTLNSDGTITIVGYEDAVYAKWALMTPYQVLVWSVGSVATTLPVTEGAIVKLNDMLGVTAPVLPAGYTTDAQFAADVTTFVEVARAAGE